MDSEVDFRYAERNDVALILRFIKELAEYEKMSDEVVADEKVLGEQGFIWKTCMYDKNTGARDTEKQF